MIRAPSRAAAAFALMITLRAPLFAADHFRQKAFARHILPPPMRYFEAAIFTPYHAIAFAIFSLFRFQHLLFDSRLIAPAEPPFQPPPPLIRLMLSRRRQLPPRRQAAYAHSSAYAPLSAIHRLCRVIAAALLFC